jgi:hypothetical protein
VWSFFVVVFPPISRSHSGLPQAFEFFHGQELVAEPAVEALGVAVLPRASWFDVERLHTDMGQPFPDRQSDELRSIVTANRDWDTSANEEFGQGVDHIFRGDASIDLPPPKTMDPGIARSP